jgi:hypothetical protein
MGSLALILLFVALFFVLGFPVFVIGQRRGLRNPWVAFVPVLGVWIVLFEAIGKSGWYSLLAFLPYVGGLIMLLWTAVELPARHGRSRWWTLLPHDSRREPDRLLVLRVHAAAQRRLLRLATDRQPTSSATCWPVWPSEDLA